MNQLNSVLIEGRIHKAAESRVVGGITVLKFTIASTRYDNNKEIDVVYIDIEVWGKIDGGYSGAVEEGRDVRVVGRLKQNQVYDSENKVSFKQIVIVAEHIEFKEAY